MLSRYFPDSLLSCAALAPLLLGLACGPADPVPGEDFGSGITLLHVTPFAEILSDPEAFADQLILTQARVYDVCQRKGCWMVLREGDEQIRAGFGEAPPNVYGFGHRAFLANVIESLTERGSALVDGFEGKKSLELIHAIYESAELGRTVDVPCRPVASKLGRAYRG